MTEEEYGRGSYAAVVKLEYRGLKCAGKKLHYVLVEEGVREIVYRFEGECRLLAQMRHPNIVQFIGVYFEEDSEIPILVMEFLPTTLARCIDTYGVLPEEVSYAILLDVALGLYHLHSQTPPIVHRDLSANNVLLASNMTAKISDLGVAKILNLTPLQLSRMTRAPGTLAYMPPEALSEHPRYDTRIDEFSYGVLMIHVLCGRWPFPCEPVRVNPHNQDELLPLSEAERRNQYLRDIGNAHPLMGLIRRCVSNNPERRARAAEIVQQVEHMTRQSPPTFANRIEMLQRIRADATEKGSLREENETFAAEYEQSRLEREELIQQHQAEVEQVRTEMRAQNESHQIEMRAQNEAHQTEMRAQNETHRTEMRALNETHRTEVEQVRTEVTAELTAQNTTSQTQLRGEIQRLKQLAQLRQEEIERSEIARSIEVTETRLQLQEALQMELRAQAQTHQAEMRTQNEKHQAEMRSQNEIHQAEMRTQNKTHQAEMRTQNETHQAEMRTQNETHQFQTKTQNETYQAEMRAQNEARELERRSLINELDSLRNEVSRLRGVNESLQATVRSKDETIQSNAREISSNRVVLASNDATLTQKESELASKNAILERQSSTIREQNEQLTRAREFLSGQKPQV